MISTKPFNIQLMDVDEFILSNNCQEVTSLQIYEPSSTKFHKEGLFSEEIFGEIGSTMRYATFGYIDLHTPVFHPLIYTNLVSMRSIYKDIMSSKAHAYFDEREKDFVLCPNTHPDADTGYAFFINNFPNIKFSKTESNERNIKLKIFEKYKKINLINKCLVMPAGIRDASVDSTGRTTSDEINELYGSLISLSNAIPKDMNSHPIFNSVRFNIQLKIVEIYEYISNILKGKHGYGSGKYMARRLAHGTRNVLSSVILEGNSPDDPKYIKHDETFVPLFQTMKMFQPIVQYYLMEYFFNILTNDSNTIATIDTKTFNLSYITITDKEKNKYTTNDGLEILINKFIDKHDRELPITIKDENDIPYYLVLKYLDGDRLTLVRSKKEFKSKFLDIDTLMSNESNVNKLDVFNKLNLGTDDYIIVSSGAMVMYGYDHENRDLDIVLSASAKQYLLDKGMIIEKNGKYTDSTNSIDFGPIDKKTFTFEELVEYSTIIGHHNYLSIDGLIYFYNKLLEDTQDNKYKDRLDWLRSLTITKIFDPSLLTPLTWVELFYMITYRATYGKHMLNTRYPVIHVESIYPSKVHVATTRPSRSIILMADDEPAVLLPEYPVLGAQYIDAMAIHHSQLSNLGADFDGDTGNGTGVMSDEANKELDNYLNSISSIVNAKGELISDVTDDTLVPYVLFNMSRTRIKPVIDLSSFRPSLSRIKHIELFKHIMPLSESILIGDSLLSVLGLTQNTSLFTIVTDHIFNLISLSKQFAYDVKQDEYHTENNEVSVFLKHYNLTFDDLIYDAIQIDSVWFAHPKYMYNIYKKQNTSRSKELCKIYEIHLSEYIK